MPSSKKLHIFSTGYGYSTETVCPNKNWEIHCVRGPLTSKALGIDQKYAIADGAILTADFMTRSQRPKFRHSYMPHFVNANNRWKNVSEEVGIKFIDPTQSVVATLQDLSETEVLFTEAMHGAIIADSLGIPWVPVVSSKIINTFKWEDYCHSMGIEYQPCRLPPMSATVSPTITGKLRAAVKYKWVKSEFEKIRRSKMPTMTPRIIMDERRLQLHER